MGEYLIYRGFTRAFRALEEDGAKDKTKQFDSSKIVDAVFNYLQGYEIEQFINLWDFLSKRFFSHLDQEHLMLSGILKSDLLKFYLANAFKQKNKERVSEFFSMYSHEILAESSDQIAGGLRGWFVLPYMEEPEKDPEFSAFFTSGWADSLRTTLSNFLSIVLRTAPPPKLLLLEKWFRSEAQQEIRSQLKMSALRVDVLLARLERSEERLSQLRCVVKDLATFAQKASRGGGSQSAASTRTTGLFETDEEAEDKRLRVMHICVCFFRVGKGLCSTTSSNLTKLSIPI